MIFESSTFTHTLDYAYNTNGKISTITDQKGRVTNYTYDLNGNVVKKTHANGYELEFAYDALNRLKTQQSGLFVNSYKYDLNGNVVYLDNSEDSTSPWVGAMEYDSFDRLIHEEFSDYTDTRETTYIYDKNSNRVGLEVCEEGMYNHDTNISTSVYELNSLNQIKSVTTTEQSYYASSPIGDPTVVECDFQYDNRGRLYSINDGTYSRYCMYDVFDMLTTAWNARNDSSGADYESVLTRNKYDYRGRRISREISTNNASAKKASKQYSYSDGVSVLESSYTKTTLTYRGSDQGGGVGGINYAEYSDGSE